MPIDIRIGKTEIPPVSGGDMESQPIGEQGKMSVQTSAVVTALISSGKQIISQSINEYGNITGDYMMAESIDTALSIGADLLMIAKGGIVGTIAVATKHATNIFRSEVRTDRARRDIDLNRELLGSIYINGGRIK